MIMRKTVGFEAQKNLNKRNLFQIVNGVDAITGKKNTNKKPKYGFDKLKTSSMNVTDARSSRNLLQNMSKTASGDKYVGSKRNLFDTSGKSSNLMSMTETFG
jgi:hypothetical protein